MRSGARGRIHPFKDRTEISFPVRWYRAKPGAKFLGLPTCFVWDQWRARNVEDEVFPGFENAYKYDKGSAPPPVDGQGLCGTDGQWLGGCLTTDPVGPLDPVTGQPACCFPEVQLQAFGVGGLVAGGPGLTLVNPGDGLGGLLAGGGGQLGEGFAGSGGLLAGGGTSYESSWTGAGGTLAGGLAVAYIGTWTGAGGLLTGAGSLLGAAVAGAGGTLAGGSSVVGAGVEGGGGLLMGGASSLSLVPGVGQGGLLTGGRGSGAVCFLGLPLAHFGPRAVACPD